MSTIMTSAAATSTIDGTAATGDLATTKGPTAHEDLVAAAGPAAEELARAANDLLSPTDEPATTPPRPDWPRLIEAVKDSGQYTTTKEAERVTRLVLSTLGGHVVGDERVELARRLPEEAARLIASQIPVTCPLTAPEFVDSVAARIEGATPATARWDVSAVLSALPELIGDGLTSRLLAQLPTGYALLFGKADLLTRAA
ncbi:DUF2267 domain-containing protein [Streptomyces sp. NPDC047079]|uniref:DUF2267 domain-containing protein n=1 Tax=Streptomyces sp. NPDC047079 TaxID=3154607 RepID=UPI0033D8295C